MGLFAFRKRTEIQPMDTEMTGPPAPTTAGATGRQRASPAATSIITRASRILQLLLAILILGLVSYAEHVYASTFLRSAYVPALIAAVLTILATLPLMFAFKTRSASLPRRLLHPFSVAGIDLFFALSWLAIMAELAAYSDVSSPNDEIYYTGFDDGEAYATYSDTLRRLKRAWACGATAAAFAGVEFVLFLANALIPLRLFYRTGPVAQQDSVGVPKNHHGTHHVATAEAPYEMQRTSNSEGLTETTGVLGGEASDGQVLANNERLGKTSAWEQRYGNEERVRPVTAGKEI